MMNLTAEYWRRIVELAKSRGADGCTAVSEWRQECCYEHDVHYSFKHRWVLHVVGWDGTEPEVELMPGPPITRAEADARYRECMRKQGGFWNDARAWIRWLGTRAGGWWGWHDMNGRIRGVCGG